MYTCMHVCVSLCVCVCGLSLCVRLKEASCFAFSLLRYTGSALLHSLSTLCVRAHHPFISSSCLPPISFTHACTTKTRSVHLPSFLILLHTCSSPLHVTVLSL